MTCSAGLDAGAGRIDHGGVAGSGERAGEDDMTDGEQNEVRAVMAELADYDIDGLLGEGGMGTVYSATRCRDGRAVAIKVIRPDLAIDASVGFRARFRRELTLCSSFAHPYVITIIDGGVAEDGSAYIVMEYINGMSLAERLFSGKLDKRELVARACHLAEALSYIHAKGIYHRDIKPENVLLPSADRTVLTDFGLAFTSGQTRLTETGGVVGSFMAMSPEQLLGTESSAASDVYGYGVTLYIAATGQYPFSTEQLLNRACGRKVAPPRTVHELVPELKRPLSDLIMQCLETDVADRPRNGSELFAALDAIIAAKSASAPVDTGRAKETTGLTHLVVRRRTLGAAAIAMSMLVASLLLLNAPPWSVDGRPDQAAALVKKILSSPSMPSKSETANLARLIGVVETGTVDNAAQGHFLLVAEACTESSPVRAYGLLQSFLERHGQQWFAAGMTIPVTATLALLEEVPQRLKTLTTLTTITETLDVAERRHIAPLLSAVMAEAVCPEGLHNTADELAHLSERLLPLVTPLVGRAGTPEQRQEAYAVVFCALLLDVRPAARHVAVAWMKRVDKLATTDVIDKATLMDLGATALTKTKPSGVTDRSLRELGLIYRKRCLALVTTDEQRLKKTLAVVEALKKLGRQQEGLALLDERLLVGATEEGDHRRYWTTRATVLRDLGQFAAAIACLKRARQHAVGKALRHVDDDIRNIRSMAVIRGHRPPE